MRSAIVLAAGLLIAGCTTNNNTYVVGSDGSASTPDAGPACTANAKECVSDTLARVCPADGAGWLGVSCQPGEKCDQGECKPDIAGTSCAPGDAVCVDATTALVCNDNGVGYKQVSCPAGTNCGGNGLCFGTCVVGESRCDDLGTLSTCKDGKSFTPEACPANSYCLNVQQSPFGVGKCIPATDCKPDPNGCDTVCGNKLDPNADQTKFVSTCVATLSGFHWEVSGCLQPKTCSPAAGQCADGVSRQAACSSECTPGAKRCSPDGTGIQTCGTDGKWGAITACDVAASKFCFPDPQDPATPVCGDLECAAGAKGVCVLDNGVSKLRPCKDGVLAALTELVTCNPGLCALDPSVTQLDPSITPAGACVVECQSGDTRCAGGAAYQTCGANGIWSSTTTACAAAQGCFDTTAGGRPKAICGDCQPGTHRCVTAGGTPQSPAPDIETCGATGQWAAAVACTVGSCFQGGSDAACIAECVPNAKRCTGASVPVPGTNIDGTAQVETCQANGTFGTATTCGAGTVCRSNQAGNGLGCLVCVGTQNENGLVDTRCSNTAGTSSGIDAVQTCNSTSTAWQAPVTCTGGETCQPPSAPSPNGLAPYCHDCFGIGACTESTLEFYGATCDAIGGGAPMSCGSDGDCCSSYCSADVPTPAVCAP